MASIEVDHVSVSFRVRQTSRITLKEFLVRKMYKGSVNPRKDVLALDRISFAARPGDRIGIIGHNGAGKSTLLKMLAGVYPPTAGKRLVEGQISSLFDIALGFETEATGWENIRYRGYLQGETPRSIAGKLDDIAEFSELGSFLDMPVRHYSAGMVVRLAFAIATAIEPEVLLVDEVLAVGDLAFQAKARRRMQEMMKRAEIIVMVSHDLHSVLGLCDRALWIDHGAIRMDGPAKETVNAYWHSVHGTNLAA